MVEYLGVTFDVRPYLADCTVFVLPSYYREGLPRTILEAMSVGRAVVTTDAPGCHDAVVDGINGLLVPVRDSGALAAAMERLIQAPDLVMSMGQRGREQAKARFDVRQVNALMLESMDLCYCFPGQQFPRFDRARHFRNSEENAAC